MGVAGDKELVLERCASTAAMHTAWQLPLRLLVQVISDLGIDFPTS